MKTKAKQRKTTLKSELKALKDAVQDAIAVLQTGADSDMLDCNRLCAEVAADLRKAVES